MSTHICIPRLISANFKETGRVILSGRIWSSLHLSGPCRGTKSVASVEEPILTEEQAEEKLAEENRIKKIRNISRLRPWHRNIVNNLVPQEENVMPWHYTVLYHRKLFGRYGYGSGVKPGLCWPTKEELADIKEYERVAYPYSILEVANRERAKKEQKEKELFERDATIAKNMKAMEKAKQEFLAKKLKQKQEAEAAKAFKIRLIEEVRLHFNYTVKERDDRFRLELKERARLLHEKAKKEKKMARKERTEIEKAQRFEALMQKMKEENEAKKAAAEANKAEGTAVQEPEKPKESKE